MSRAAARASRTPSASARATRICAGSGWTSAPRSSLQVSNIDPVAWKAELALHDELFAATRLPPARPVARNEARDRSSVWRAERRDAARFCATTRIRARVMRCKCCPTCTSKPSSYEPRAAPLGPRRWCSPATSTAPGRPRAFSRLAGSGDLRCRQPRIRRARAEQRVAGAARALSRRSASRCSNARASSYGCGWQGVCALSRRCAGATSTCTAPPGANARCGPPAITCA